MKSKVWILFSIVVVLVFVEILVFAPVDVFDGDSETPIAQPTLVDQSVEGTSKMSGADQMMSGVHILGTKKSGREWELWADTAEGYNDKGLWLLNTVKTDFFAINGAVYNVKGEKGEVDQNSKNLIVTGNVVMRSSNGYTFKTEKLMYNSEDKLITSPVPVKVIGPRESSSQLRLHLNGDRLKASLDDSFMWVTGNVKTRKALEDGRLARIQCDSARLSGVDNSVQFSEDVEIDVDGMRVTGPAAVFQYSKDGKKLESVLVEGGARLSEKDKWATADEVDFSLMEDRVVFRGNPRLVHGGDELRGEEIIFTKNGKRVQVVKARAKVSKQEGTVE